MVDPAQYSSARFGLALYSVKQTLQSTSRRSSLDCTATMPLTLFLVHMNGSIDKEQAAGIYLAI